MYACENFRDADKQPISLSSTVVILLAENIFSSCPFPSMKILNKKECISCKMRCYRVIEVIRCTTYRVQTIIE